MEVFISGHWCNTKSYLLLKVDIPVPKKRQPIYAIQKAYAVHSEDVLFDGNWCTLTSPNSIHFFRFLDTFTPCKTNCFNEIWRRKKWLDLGNVTEEKSFAMGILINNLLIGITENNGNFQRIYLRASYDTQPRIGID